MTLYLIPRACSESRYNQTCLKRAVSLGGEPGTPEHAGDAITDGSGYCVKPAPTHEQSPSLSSKTRLLTSPSFQTDTYLQVGKEDSPVHVGCRDVVPLPSQHISGCCTPDWHGQEQASICRGVVLVEPTDIPPVLASCRAMQWGHTVG